MIWSWHLFKCCAGHKLCRGPSRGTAAAAGEKLFSAEVVVLKAIRVSGIGMAAIGGACGLEGSPSSVLLKATNFAAEKHKGQKRKDEEGTPYINHPIGVAHLLSSLGSVSDLPTLVAALLHDTVEDTETSLDEIQGHFGVTVRNIVAEVTDDKSLPSARRKELQVEHAPGLSREAKLVKLADKLYNLIDLQRCTPLGWDEQRVQNYFEWAARVIKGLLGSNEVLESELENVLASKNVSLK